MIILKVKANDIVKTFVMSSIYQAKKAEKFFKATGAAYYIAEVENIESTKGKILAQNQGDNHPGFVYYQQEQFGRETCTLGTESECRKLAEEIRAKQRTTADPFACVKQIADTVWVCEEIDYYMD